MQVTMTGQVVEPPRRRWVRSRVATSPQPTRDADFNWLMLLLATIVLEGALRKWVLPGALQPIAYGAKDILAALFILSHPLPRVQSAIKNLQTAAFMVGFILLPSFIMGLVHNPLAAISTYKNAVLWPVFAVHLAPRLSGRIIARLMPVLAIVSCGMAVLGAIQFVSSPDAFLNRYAWRDMGDYVPVALFGTGTRASGTFSYIAGMGAFSIFCFSTALWRFLLLTSHYQKILAGLTAAASVCCAVESGSRAPVVTFVLMFIAATLVARRVKVLLRIWAVILCIGLAVVFVLGPSILASFIDRWETAGDTTVGRITGENLKGNVVDLIMGNPVGVGLGRATGYGAYKDLRKGVNPEGFDDGGSNALLESGLFGLLGLWMITIALVALVVPGLTSNSHEFRSASALLGVFSAYWVWSGIWYNHTATAFTWLSIAIWLGCQKGRAWRPNAGNVRRKTGDSSGAWASRSPTSDGSGKHVAV